MWGLKVGYCLMVGGAEEAVSRLEPIFLALAPENGYAHVGPSGAGHYVKMIHNGIEYGLLQAYAEGFALLDAAPEFGLDLHQIAELWRHGSVVRSWLLELAERALADPQEFARIKGYVDDSGEGRWTVEESINRAVATPVITASLFARFSSRDREAFPARLIAALRNQFGGHQFFTESAAGEVAQPVADEGVVNPQRDAGESAGRCAGGERRAPPCVLVVFGASGDLTSPQADARARAPGRQPPIAVGLRRRRRGPHADDRRRVPPEDARHGGASRRRRGSNSWPASATSPASTPIPTPSTPWPKRWRRSTRSGARPATASTTWPRSPPSSVRSPGRWPPTA